MKKSIDSLILAIFLCASSIAQSDEPGKAETDEPGLSRNSFAFASNELHFNYELVKKSQISDATKNRKKAEAELDRYRSRSRPQTEAAPPSQKKKFITKGKAQQQYPSYVGRNVIGSMRAKRSGQMYIWH